MSKLILALPLVFMFSCNKHREPKSIKCYSGIYKMYEAETVTHVVSHDYGFSFRDNEGQRVMVSGSCVVRTK